MKNFCLTISLAALACLCGCKEPEPNVLTSEEEVRGWNLLWDGDDPVNGWAGVSAGCSNFTARGWSVANRALVASAGADPIRTVVPYKDFDLKVDYRMAPGVSGRILYFHNAETNVDSSITYALTPSPSEKQGPLGWQTARIAGRRRAITHWLTGQVVERKTRSDVDLDGRIVLDPGSGPVEFRNIKVFPFGKW